MVKPEVLKDKIEHAFKLTEFSWRTAEGIARDVGAPVQDVEAILLGAAEFLELPSRTRNGQRRFTMRETFVANASPFERLLGSIKNRLI
jgi:hypothetical protein